MYCTQERYPSLRKPTNVMSTPRYKSLTASPIMRSKNTTWLCFSLILLVFLPFVPCTRLFPTFFVAPFTVKVFPIHSRLYRERETEFNHCPTGSTGPMYFVFCHFYPSSPPPRHHGSVISLILTNTVSPVRLACLIT